MNGLVDAWGFWGFHAAWQAAAVAAVILVGVWFGRRWPAPIRYGLLLVVLAKFALPPIVSLPMSPFSYCGPDVAHVESETVAPVAFEPQPIPVELPPVMLDVSEPEEFRPEFAATAPELPEMQPMPSLPPTPAADEPWNWKLVLLSIHLSGMALVVGWLAVQWLRLRQLQRSAHEALDEQIHGRFAFLSKQLGMRRSVRLLIGSNDTVPCSFGLLRPVVVVPETLVSELSEDLDRVLAHELAHHRRGDLWINAVQLGLFIVWWFNPLYWLLHRSLRAVREDCCDDLLLATGIASPGDYCDTILRVASNQKSTGPLAIASSMADYPHPLEKRFRRIMDGSLRRSVRLGWLGLAAVVVLAVVLLPGARGSGEPEEEPLPEAEVEQAEWIDSISTPEPILWETPRLGEPRRVVGRVVDESGEPVVGARVWLPLLKSEDQFDTKDWLTAEAGTDKHGKFILDIPGRWMSAQRLNQYGHTVWAYLPGKQVGVERAFDMLFREDEEEIEIVLASETKTRVVVKTPDGNVATDVRVAPNRDQLRGYLPHKLAGILSGRTDGSGAVELHGLPREHMVLTVEADGFGKQFHRRNDDTADDRLWEVRLVPVGRVIGRVEGDADLVRDLRVTMLTLNAMVEIDTDEFGRFEAEDVAVGSLSVSAKLPREADSRLRLPARQSVSEGETTEVVLRSEPGVLAEGRIVAEDTGKPIANAMLQITSQCIPIPGAPAGLIMGTAESQRDEVMSDEQGRFSARVLPGWVGCSTLGIPGPYCQSLESQRTGVEIPVGVQRFHLPTIYALRQELLSGRVIDHDGGPVANAQLTVLGAEGQSIRGGGGRTDETGSFQGLAIPAESDREMLQYMVVNLRPQPARASITQSEPLILQLPPPPNQDTGTIVEGRIVDQFGSPVEGASVSLYSETGDNDQYGGVPSSLIQLKTDGEGTFRTTDWLKRGYLYGVATIRNRHQNLPPVGHSRVEATGSLTSLGDILVCRWWPLRGRVVNQQSQPIANATLTYQGPTAAHHFQERTEVAKADADGRFSFPGLCATGGKLVVAADGYQDREWKAGPAGAPDGGLRIVLVQNAGDAKSEKEGTPSADATQTGTETEEPAKEGTSPPQALPRRNKSRTIVGRIVDESGEPVAGAKIWLPIYDWTATATTDDRGGFRLEVPAEVLRRRIPHRQITHVWAYAPDYSVGIASAYDALFDEQGEPILLQLAPESQTAITVVTPDGSPAAGATVEPYRCLATTWSMLVPDELAAILRTTTDESGCTQLSAIVPHSIGSLAVTTEQSGCQLIQPDADRLENEPWRIELRPVGKVVGQIACDDPESVASVRLALRTYGDPKPPYTTVPPRITEGYARVVTDDQGRFTVEHMAVGRLHLFGSLANESRSRLWIPDWYDVTEGDTTNVKLEARVGVPVTGTVVEEKTKKPVQGAYVRLSPYGRSQGAHATTDEHGRYSTYAVPGTTGYSATAPNYVRSRKDPLSASIQVPNDASLFEMPAIHLAPVDMPRAVRGRLIDGQGRSVPHAIVTAYRGDTAKGQKVGSGSTDARGLLRLAGIHLGEELAKLTFYVEGFCPQPVPANLIQDDPLVLRVVPLSERTGTRITGRVIDQRGEPVEGAAFYLEARPDETELRKTLVRFSHERPLLRTDGAGRFQTPEFYRREWQYRITVESAARQQAYGTSEWITASDSITDLGDIPVNRSFSVRGRVVDESGKPIRGATVTLPPDEGTVHTETTDADGRFAFRSVFGSGRYQFKIVADGYQTYEKRTPISKEDREKRDGGPTIVLQRKASGDTSGRKEGSSEASSGTTESEAPKKESSSPQMLLREIPRLGEHRTIQGRVVDETGEPVPGAKIWLPVRWDRNGPMVAKGVSDNQGDFRLEVPGKWMADADPRSHFFWTVWAYAPERRVGIASAYNALFDEESEPVQVVLGKQAKTSVAVFRPDGSPAAGVTVEPYHFKGTQAYEIIPPELVETLRVRTNNHGIAHFPALAIEKLSSLEIEAEGLGRQFVRKTSRSVEANQWEAHLLPTGRVVGQIVSDNPELAAGVRLQLDTTDGFLETSGALKWDSTEGIARVTTDADGSFEVEHLATGRMRIHGSLPNEREERLRIPGDAWVKEGQATEVTLTVDPGVLVTGRIVEQGTGRPVAGAELAVRYGEAAQGERTISDQDGRFSARVLAGEVSVSVGSIPGNYMQPEQSRQATVKVPADAKLFELPPTEVVPYQILSGRLIDHQGQPVSDAQVRTVRPGPKSSAKTDHEGRFVLDRLPSDASSENLTFQVTEVRHRPLSAKVVKTAPLLLKMEPRLTSETGTIVSGRIVDKLGIPVADARVTLEEREDEKDLGKLSSRLGYPPETTITDQDGQFEFPELLDRERQYRVTVAPKSLYHLCRGNSKWITATGPATSMGEFVVDRVWSARGQVVDEAGKPITGATVTYDRKDASPIVVQTSADGRFAFRGVFSDFYGERFPWPNVVQFGPYPLRVEAQGYQTYDQPTYIQDAKIERADAGARIVLVRQKPPTALKLLQGVERVRTTFPRPIAIEIEAQFEEKRLRNGHRNRVIFDGNRYRFHGINDDRVNSCSIFDGTTAMHYDGTGSCTIRPPSNWTADYLFDPRTLGLTTLLQPGRDVAACLAYRDAKQVVLIGKETMGTERRAVGETWHVRVVDKHDQRLDFWIELPYYWVTKCEYRFNDIYRVADSQWSDRGVFPDEVAIKRYSSNRLVSETTLKTLRMLELLELPPGIWTLAGLGLPVGTPVVKLGVGRQGYWNGKEVVSSLSESTPR